MILWFVVLFLAISNIGCLGFHNKPWPTETTPITIENGKMVSAQNLYRADLTSPSTERNIKVTFLRDSGYLGSACPYKLFIDGQSVLTIGIGRYQTLYLTSGTHLFELRQEDPYDHCVELSAWMTTILKEGTEKTYRIHIFIPTPQEGMRVEIIEMK